MMARLRYCELARVANISEESKWQNACATC
jgi:hypothetical protein